MKIENKIVDGVHYRFFLPEHKVKKILITIHGFAGDSASSTIEAIAEVITQNDYLVVAFDLPCHGNDENNCNLNLKLCFDYFLKCVQLIKKTYGNCPISCFATSFGAYILLNNLGKLKNKFEHIILKSPAIYMNEVLVKILKNDGINANDFKTPVDLGFERTLWIDETFLQSLTKNSLENKKFSNHIDIIQGDKDDVVDIRKNENFFKRNFMDYTLNYIKGADHRFKNDGELEQIVNLTKLILLSTRIYYSNFYL